MIFGGRAAPYVEVRSDSLIIAKTPAIPEVGCSIPAPSHVRVGNDQQPFTLYYCDFVEAPQLDGFERVLLPAYNCDLRGSHGSEWCTTLTLFNGGKDSALIYPAYQSGRGINALTLRPLRTTSLSLLRPIANSFTETAPVSARVIYVERDFADLVHFNLRLFDSSRNAATWGTDVPVIRERDLLESRAQMFPGPIAPRFRVALRIYDPLRSSNASVVVRFFEIPTERLLATRTLSLVALTRQLNGVTEDVSYPGLAEIGNLAALPELAGFDGSIRIEVEPVTAGLRFWAMVSVTNDETQHVTLVTPAAPTAARHVD